MSFIRRLIGGYIAVYPTLLLVLYVTKDLTKGLPFALAIAINASILVPCILFLALPLSQKMLAYLWPIKPRD